MNKNLIGSGSWRSKWLLVLGMSASFGAAAVPSPIGPVGPGAIPAETSILTPAIIDDEIVVTIDDGGGGAVTVIGGGPGPWRKVIDLGPPFDEDDLPVDGQLIFINEFLRVADGEHWKTWNELLVLSPEWEWVVGGALFVDGVPVATGTISGDSMTFSNFFAAEGELVDIVKAVRCVVDANEGDDVCATGPIIDQYPGIPEPGTLLLLAVGLAGLALRRRRTQ